MKRKDYSKYILPTTLINNDSEKETISTDLIFIRTKEEIEESKFKLPDNYKDPISDFALYNGAYAKKDDAGNPNCPIGCRFLYYDGSIMVRDGNTFNFSYSFKCDALPAFNIKLPKKNSPILKSIRPYILNNETLFYTLELGENAQGLVSCELNNTLESLYNNGKLGEGLESTGLWVTTNAAEPNDYDNTFISRQNPEFIFQGQRYIRQAEPAFWKLVNDATLSNGEKLNKNDISAKWFKVEPVKYKILNWDKLPLYINPNGNGSDDRIELEALQVQISGLAYDMVWENSVARAFLSSSTLSSRNLNYSKSGFLYQTLNLKRQPIKEYAISKAESKVCEHAFDGCVQLEKIVLHEDLKSIGKTAFNGCNFKYVYKLKSSSDTIFAKIPPKNIKECQCFIDLEKLEKHCITPNINLVYFLLEDYSKILPHLEGDQKVFLYPSSDQGKEEMLEIFEVYRAKGYDYVYKIKGTADHIISKN